MQGNHAKYLKDAAVEMRNASTEAMAAIDLVVAEDVKRLQDKVVRCVIAAEAYEFGAAAIARVAELEKTLAEMTEATDKTRQWLEEASVAFEEMRKYRWFVSDPDFLEQMVEAENECWNQTRIPPPGRSVPFELLAPPDEERAANWSEWIKAKRTASLERFTAAMAKLAKLEEM